MHRGWLRNRKYYAAFRQIHGTVDGPFGCKPGLYDICRAAASFTAS